MAELSSSYSSIRKDLLSCWPKFFKSLLSGPSPEPATLARVATGNRRSTTAAKNALLLAATSIRAWTATAAEVRSELQGREEAMTPEQLSTTDYLLELMQT